MPLVYSKSFVFTLFHLLLTNGFPFSNKFPLKLILPITLKLSDIFRLDVKVTLPVKVGLLNLSKSLILSTFSKFKSILISL